MHACTRKGLNLSLPAGYSAAPIIKMAGEAKNKLIP